MSDGAYKVNGEVIAIGLQQNRVLEKQLKLSLQQLLEEIEMPMLKNKRRKSR
jgi:hypothetical protein